MYIINLKKQPQPTAPGKKCSRDTPPHDGCPSSSAAITQSWPGWLWCARVFCGHHRSWPGAPASAPHPFGIVLELFGLSGAFFLLIIPQGMASQFPLKGSCFRLGQSKPSEPGLRHDRRSLKTQTWGECTQDHASDRPCSSGVPCAFEREAWKFSPVSKSPLPAASDQRTRV